MEDILKIMELLVVVSVAVAGVEEVRHELGFGRPRFPSHPTAQQPEPKKHHPRPNLHLVGNDHRWAP